MSLEDMPKAVGNSLECGLILVFLPKAILEALDDLNSHLSDARRCFCRHGDKVPEAAHFRRSDGKVSRLYMSCHRKRTLMDPSAFLGHQHHSLGLGHLRCSRCGKWRPSTDDS